MVKGNRQYVHLSKDRDTAIAVGKRHGEPIIYLINALEMYKEGYDFYLSENDVWLIDWVPTNYLKQEKKGPDFSI